MNNSITVYWGLYVDPLQFAERALITKEPIRLLTDLKDIYNPDSHIFLCPSVRNKHQNTFVYKLPFDVKVSTMNGTTFVSEHPNVTQRISMYKDAFAFDIDYQIIFFCFEDLEMQTSPAYFHQTSYSSLGHIPSGQFNIGKWYRPSAPNISMFPNMNIFKADRDEALVYYHFLTEKKVILKQFFVNDLLLHIGLNNVDHKKYVQNQSLKEIYARAKQGKINKVIQKEILNNLLD